MPIRHRLILCLTAWLTAMLPAAHGQAEIVAVLEGHTVNEFAWSDDNSLIYAQPIYEERVQRLFLWRGGQIGQPIVDTPLNAFWCAGGGRLVVATGFQGLDGVRQVRMDFLSGTRKTYRPDPKSLPLNSATAMILRSIRRPSWANWRARVKRSTRIIVNGSIGPSWRLMIGSRSSTS